MINKVNDYYNNEFGFSQKVLKLSNQVEESINVYIQKVNQIKEYNQIKVIKKMQANRLSEMMFKPTTGYGYDDVGRDVLDKVFADIVGSEDALVRHNFVCGTHALYIALSANLVAGDEILSVTGKPYDTLEEVIGIRGNNFLSLKNQGVLYNQIDLKNDGKMDFEKIKDAINEKTTIVFIQRSKGYSIRPTIMIKDIKEIVELVKTVNSKIIVMVDNCYGEFVEEMEPTEVGCDLIVGSFIKNPGGGIATTGGYIAGNKEYVKRAAERMTSPGLGKKVGASLGFNREFFQGLFFAPHVVAESVKGAIFCGAIMKSLGYKIYPEIGENRGDIIQAIEFGAKDPLVLFCKGIQKGSPVDSFVTPEPWDMPGYDSPIIMAAGAFTQGSSIELSADAPIKPPYIAYMQGGLVYESCKLGVLTAVQMMFDEGVIFDADKEE